MTPMRNPSFRDAKPLVSRCETPRFAMRNPSFRDAKHAFRFGLLSVHTTPERNRPGRLPLSCGACDVDPKAYLAATIDAAIRGHCRCPSSRDCFVAIARPEGRASLDPYAPRHDGSRSARSCAKEQLSY